MTIKNNEMIKENPRVIVYAVGQRCKDWFNRFDQLGTATYPFRLIAFSDADPEKQGTMYLDKEILPPDLITSVDYDYLLISSVLIAEDVIEFLTNQYGVPRDKILLLDDFNEIAASLNRDIESKYIEKKYQKNLIRYKKNERIRIVFLFQIASFWPSWESFYEECVHNEKFEVKLVLLDEIISEKVQTKTARKFLIEKELPFIEFSAFNIETFRPHIIVYQSPYDKTHRHPQNWARNMKAKGIRIVYIPYGIEIGDTENSRNDNFDNPVVTNAWRVFTISEKMMEEYKKFSANYDTVRAVGLPKFDSLFHKEKYRLPYDIYLKANGRKICLWKAHFPKNIEINGKGVQITPYLRDYLMFAEKIKEFHDIYFIFMPHPKFREMCRYINGAVEEADKLFDILNSSENASIFEEDDYRPVLANTDYVITDRSSIMVEAGALNVPVLYLYNYKFQEPMNQAISPLVESYYQGISCDDIIKFLNMCRQGQDPKRDVRQSAFHECIPYYDGECGKRIAANIIRDMNQELDISIKKHQELADYLSQRLEDSSERKLLADILDHRIYSIPIPNMEDFKLFSQKVENHYSPKALMDISGGYTSTRYFNFMEFDELKIPFHSWTFTSTAKIMYSNQYNHPQVHIEKGDYVLDAGALFGDTSLWFSFLTGETGRVFTFEFTPAFLERIRNNFELNPELASRITVNGFAIWDRSGEMLSFVEQGGATHINEVSGSEETVKVETITIDDWAEKNDIDKLDFVKMDIEGAEVRALHGARRTIQRLKPKLAICLYHRDDDFVAIPKLIDSFGVDYEFYLGHHTAALSETVLYAKPRV